MELWMIVEVIVVVVVVVVVLYQAHTKLSPTQPPLEPQHQVENST